MALLLATVGWSQTTTPTLTLTGVLPPSATSVKPGDTVTLNVNLTTAGASVSDVQFSVTLPAGWTYTAATGASANTAGKSIQCAPNSTVAPGTDFCIVYGINANTLTDGVVASFTAVVPQSQGDASLALALSQHLGADPTGSVVQVAISAPFTLPVVVPVPISKCDLNGDGVTDRNDVQIALNQALGIATGLSGDLDGNGVVNVVDVRRIEAATLPGGVCRVGP